MRHDPRTHGETLTQQRCRQRTHAADEQPTESWLQPGERVHAEITADAWRYLAIDVPYDHRTILFGGPIGWTISAIASAIGNRRTRQAAERLAAPQWRYLGHLPIIVTNHRLMVWYENEWWPVWFAGVRDWNLTDDHLEIHFLDDPPYLLSSPHTSIITPMLKTHLGRAGADAGTR